MMQPLRTSQALGRFGGLLTVAVALALALSCRLAVRPAFAYPDPGDAVMQWNSGFGSMDLGNIGAVGGTVTGSATAEIETDSEVEITADNSANARLDGPGGESLTTEYALEVDGVEEEPYTAYDSFLSTPVIVAAPGWVLTTFDITLKVRATAPGGEAVEAGTYSATQTLTIHWVPN